MPLFKKKYSLGLLGKNPVDIRDFQLSAIQPIGVALPEEFDLRSSQSPVQNQDGLGICFPGNTLVLMGDFTYKPISEIIAGEEVFTHKGNKKRIIKTMKRKWQGTMIQIIPQEINDGIISTPEHPYLVVERKRKREKNKENEVKLKWISAKKIKHGDYLVVPLITKTEDKTIYWQEKNKDFLWLLGVYLAEGNIEGNEITFSISQKETKLKEKIISVCKKFGIIPTFHNAFKGNGLYIRFSNKFYSQLLKELGGEGVKNKKIHSRLMSLSPQLQMNIFDGWFDGDGHFDKYRKTGATISFQLAWQLRIILLRNKIPNSILFKPSWKGKDGIYHQEFYSIEIYSSPFRTIFSDTFLLIPVRKIKKIPAYAGGHVYNLKVEDDNSYIVKSVAVHNCYSFATAGIGEYWNTKEYQHLINLSERFIVYFTKKISGMWDIQGDFLRNALKAFCDNGAPLEEDYPFSTNWEDYKKEPPAEIIKKAEEFKGKTYWSVGTDLESIRQAIFQNQCPVFVGMPWYQSYNKPETDGRLPLSSGNKLGGHAIICVGWTKDKLWFKNSWGNWGNQGYFYIPFSDFSKYEIWDISVLLDLPRPVIINEGWVAQEYIRTQKYLINQEVYPYVSLNLRDAPAGNKLLTLQKGTKLKILSEPIKKGDYNWIKVSKL